MLTIFNQPRERVSLCLCMMAGVVNLFALAPFGWWPLQIMALAFLFYQALETRSFKTCFLRGWAYGLGWTTSSVYWLYISMHDYGGMPVVIAVFALLLLGLYLGSFAAFAVSIALKLSQSWRASRPVQLLLIFPALWAASDWLRGWLFTGLPWGASGYAHTTSPLAGFAPLIGVYGLSWLASLLAGLGVCLFKRKWSALILMTAILASGSLLHHFAHWTTPVGKAIFGAAFAREYTSGN